MDHQIAARPQDRDHVELHARGVAGVSDRGLRHAHNEDALAVACVDGDSPAVIAVVCDGVSSTRGAADASQAAVDAARDAFQRELTVDGDAVRATRSAVADAAAAVAALASNDGPSPSCTFVSAVVTEDEVTAGWLGDCRVYWLAHDGESARLTVDDSWATHMVAIGVMDEEQAYADKRAHAILRWLGADALDIEPKVIGFNPRESGVILVCSDGLWNYLSEPGSLAAAIPHASDEPLEAARTLVKIAIEAGGHDNITAAIIPFPPAF